MNFLAHIYLSGDDKDVMMGNFMGDFVTGRHYEGLNAGMIKGVELHRKIDEFTDNHPIVQKSKDRLYKNYHKYAPVIVDIFYDHFLAANWKQYSNVELQSFTQNFYTIAQQYKDATPAEMQYMLLHMKKDDWLYNYRLTEGIQKALTGMSRRARFNSGMEYAVNDLNAYYKDFYNEFNTFFPELIDTSNRFLADNINK